MKINADIKLPNDLPEDYPNGNLLGLEPKHYFAIIEDKQRWLNAHEQLKRPRHEAREWLEKLEPEHVKEDMRRRLNAIAGK